MLANILCFALGYQGTLTTKRFIYTCAKQFASLNSLHIW